MLRRREVQDRLLSAAWQAAAAAQQRGAHRAAGKSGPRAAAASGGRHSSSSPDSASSDHEDAKRERRRQRRAHNRELRERLCLNSAGFDFAASWGQEQRPSSRHGQRSTGAAWDCQQDSSSSESESEWEDWEVLEAVLGRPRTRAERRRFDRVWSEWQRASAAARGGAADDSSSRTGSSSSSSSNRSSSSSWAGMWSDDDEEGWHGAGSGSTYSAGNSAGPRWGKASWTWGDMHSEHGSMNGPASGDYETWYQPPPGSGGAGSRRGTAGGSRSGTGAWGWHTSGQWSAGGGWHAGWQSGSWQHDSWQHEGWQRSSGGSTAGSSSSSGGGAVAGHLRLLGLESSWLSSRCGKALRCAFLAKAKAEHPDMHVAAGSGAAAAAKERFQRVTEAYEALLAMVRP